MRISHALGNPLTAFAAFFVLAGCAGGTPQIGAPPLTARSGAAGTQSVQLPLQPDRYKNDAQTLSGAEPSGQAASHSFFNPSASGQPLIFVSVDSPGAVDIFLQAKGNTQVGQIVGDVYAPVGLATDAAGDVYIANNASGTVSIFAPPYTSPPKLTLDDLGNSPYDVAVSSEGLVAVANFNTTVSIYRKNATKPCVIVNDPSFATVEHDAFDERGDLFVDGGNNSGTLVGEIRGGCHASTIEMLSTGNVVSLSGGIKVNKHDRIAIEDVKKLAIYTYDPPKNGSLGNPVTTTPLTDSSGPANFAFVASGRDLYIADYLNGVTGEYDYPAGGSAEDTISVGRSFGVAVTPPLAP